jgi:hypothetical protein
MSWSILVSEKGLPILAAIAVIAAKTRSNSCSGLTGCPVVALGKSLWELSCISIPSVSGLLHPIPIGDTCSPVFHRDFPDHPAVRFVMQKKRHRIDSRVARFAVREYFFVGWLSHKVIMPKILDRTQQKLGSLCNAFSSESARCNMQCVLAQ